MNFEALCESVLNEGKDKGKDKDKPKSSPRGKRIQGEKRERWRKFLKKAGLNPDMWYYDEKEGKAHLIDPVNY